MSAYQLQPVVRTYSGSTKLAEVATLNGLTVEHFVDGNEHRLRVAASQSIQEEIAFGFHIHWPKLRDAHIAFPAAVYNGNRFRSRPYAYSCIVNDPEDFRADLPNTISNVHRMPRIQLLSGDVSMPAIGIGDFERGKGWWILTDPEQGGSHPLLEAIEDETGTTLSVFSPGVREGERYFGCGEKWVESEDRGWRPAGGEARDLRIQVREFEAHTPHDLYAQLFSLRHQIWMVGGRHEIPWSAAQELIESKFNDLSWDESDGYYACGDRLSRYAHWQVGWVGGGISSHALLSAGKPESQTRAMRTMDFMATKGQSPSGFYWSFCVDGEVYSDMIDMDYGHDWHLVRRSGDALYFMCKQIELARQLGFEKPIWVDSVRRCAAAFVKLWETEGQFGQFVSQITGEIRVGATTSGAIAPAGLALASQLLNDSRLLEVAAQSAQSMAERFLDLGYTSGGPGEAAQCPDSESVFGLLESFVTLFEVSADPKWLSFAEKAAWLSASWVMPYDFRFPADSTFGRLDMRTTGSVFANSQNKHSAPGICTLSGVSLFKLYRATGDVRYLDLVEEIAHGVSQYVSREDRPVFEMPPGYMCERVNTSDWEHPVTPVGEGFVASCWCETSALLTYAEIPGLYVRPDSGLVRMMDHGNVAAIREAENTFFVDVENPTSFEMKLIPFGELESNRNKTLSQDFLFGSPRVAIPAQSTVTLEFSKETGRFLANF